MGLFDIFKRKPVPEKLGEQPVNRVEETANRLSQEGRRQDIEAALADLKQGALTRTEQEAWHHLWGIVALQRDDRLEAFERFKRAAELFPDSARISFSLGQEHEFRGEIEEAFPLLDRAIFPAVFASHALMAARYAYLWHELDRGINYLRPILEAYSKLGIGDDHFLYIRGLPFISQTWSCLACFRYLKRDLDQLKRETESMAARITDYDFQPHLAKINDWMNPGSSEFEASLETALAGATKSGWSTAFQAMQLAMLKSRRQDDQKLAEGILAEVVLKPNDFPWLEDVRLLGRCEIASRFGDLTGEAGFQESFLKKQPLLFEPEHAVTFQFIDYQERLKEIYRQGRLGTH